MRINVRDTVLNQSSEFPIRAFEPLFVVAAWLLLSLSCGLHAADEPPKPNPPKNYKEAAGDAPLPKYQDMVLPSGEDLLKSKPFDWVVLRSSEVLVVEPVGPRPDTLAQLSIDYERYAKGRASFTEGEERLRRKRFQAQRLQVTLPNPDEEGDSEGLVETRLVLKIDYFEDLILRRTNLLIEEGNIPLAYDLLLLVDRRNRENNFQLTEAYEARKQEEALFKSGPEERQRIVLPELPPLKLQKSWPRYDETYQFLVFKDADLHSSRGDHEAGFRLLENLWDHNPAYSGLSEKIGSVADRLLERCVERNDFRQARFFLGRLMARDAVHPVAVKWKSNLVSRTNSLIEEARAASSSGDVASAARIIDLAARVWPDSPGLKDTHRDLITRHQSVRLGVLRLPGEPTNYPFDPAAEAEARALITQLLFEPSRIDERSVRYRSAYLDSWEPTDLGRQVQFTLRTKRADWEARSLITSADVLDELQSKFDPHLETYDERLAGVIEQVAIQSPSQFLIKFRRLPLRLEALMQFPISVSESSKSLNSDIPPELLTVAGRQRFYEHERDANHVSYRRVRPQPPTTRARCVDEIVEVRYESWQHLLQGILRGEIAGIPHVNFRDLKALQEDTRFLVLPYAMPVSHFILFHHNCAALKDGQLRRALSLAIPRDELIKGVILDGVAEPLARATTTPFPSVSYGYNRLLQQPAYDPQRAAALALTAKKQSGADLPVLRLASPPDPQVRELVTAMIEHWRRVGITVKMVDDQSGLSDSGWDMVYRTTSIVEPVTDLWPTLSLHAGARVESLRPLPERMRRQLLELERSNDWTSATTLLRRIESELLIEARYIPLWEIDDFFVTRRNLAGMPSRLMHAFHDVERWTLQPWYPQEAP